MAGYVENVIIGNCQWRFKNIIKNKPTNNDVQKLKHIQQDSSVAKK
jgi:hypothetical protein